MSTVLALRMDRVLLVLLRSHRDYTELPQRSLCSYGAPIASICVCRAMKQRCQCVVIKPNTNGITAASSIIVPLIYVYDLSMAALPKQARLLLAYVQVQQVQDDAFRYGGGSGYGSGSMSAAGMKTWTVCL